MGYLVRSKYPFDRHTLIDNQASWTRARVICIPVAVGQCVETRTAPIIKFYLLVESLHSAIIIKRIPAILVTPFLATCEIVSTATDSVQHPRG